MLLVIGLAVVITFDRRCDPHRPRERASGIVRPAQRTPVLGLPRPSLNRRLGLALVRQPTSLPQSARLGPGWQRPRRPMGLQAGDPARADVCPVGRPGRQLEAIARPRARPLAAGRQPEHDRSPATTITLS